MLVLLGKVSSKISFRELVFKVLPNSKGRGIKVMLFKKKKSVLTKGTKQRLSQSWELFPRSVVLDKNKKKGANERWI